MRTDHEVDFRLRTFGLCQQHTAMKVGTDAIVLGAWTARLGGSPKRVLDIGTGTGVLLLMMAQTYPMAEGLGIELDAGALRDAQHNVAHSPYAARLHVAQGDFAAMSLPTQAYDLIISNPPYFAAHGPSSPDAARGLARQESSTGLTLDALLHRSHTLLSSEGRLAIVVPYERLPDVRRVAAHACLGITHLCTVYSTPGVPRRVLVAMSRIEQSAPYVACQYDSLLLRDAAGRTTESYQELTRAFLLS